MMMGKNIARLCAFPSCAVGRENVKTGFFYGKKINMDRDVVLIEWLDSKGVTSSWEYCEDIKPFKPVHCISVGILFEDTADYKTIVQSINNCENDRDCQIIGRMSIPACSIIKNTKLN